MRILIINQPFYPDLVATAQHLADWSEQLVAKGHTVTVIASRSVYGSQGAILPKRDSYKGAEVYRVGANLFKKGRIITRLVDFGLFHLLALHRTLALPRQDVVVCLTTPPFLGVVGMLAKNLKGSHYVQYEMDLYPDVPIALGVMKPNSLVTRLFKAIQRKLLKSADRVIVLGRCMQRVIESKGIPAKKIALITPWADPSEIAPIPRETNPFRIQHNLQIKTVIMYSGNLGLGHDLATLLDAIKTLNGSPDPLDQSLHFVFIGGGRRMQDLETAAQSHNLKNLLLLDYQPRENLSATLSAADVHLITQAPGTAGLLVPSKFYGILAAGRPSIYIGPLDTEVAYTLTENNLGPVLPTGDTPALLQALRTFANPQTRPDPADLEHRARTLLTTAHSRQLNTEKLTRLLESLANPSSESTRPNPT